MTNYELMQTLEALEAAISNDQPYIVCCKEAIIALREKLTQPEQKPVAWLIQYSDRHEFVWGEKPKLIANAIGIEPLYTK